MKQIISLGLIIALCWTMWVPAFAQMSGTSNGFYFFNQIFLGTYMSILASLGGGLGAAGLGYFISSPLFGECRRSCLRQKEDTTMGAGILGFLAGTVLGALYGVSAATPDGIKGNWLGGIIGVGIGELIGLWTAFYLIILNLHEDVDQISLTVQIFTAITGFTSLGATLGFNLGSTTVD